MTMQPSPSTLPDLTGRAVAVFCGANPGVADFRDLARDLGLALAASHATLIYGAGRNGLMGAVCAGVVAGGGESIGVLPTFMDAAGLTSEHSTRTIITPDMHLRKAWMEEHADAFIILPGGIGTLDELCTVMTTRVLEQHAKPLVILDPSDYYDPLMHLFRHMVAHGFLAEAAVQMLRRVATPTEALCAIAEMVS